MYTDEDFKKVVNKESILKLLKKTEEDDLIEHYSFSDDVTCNIKNSEEVVEIMNTHSRLEFSFRESNSIYYKLNGEDKESIFDIDISTSFSRSDKWLSDKLIPVSVIFPNVSDVEATTEQVNFYICLLVAATLGGEFKVEFTEICEEYDFSSWKNPVDDEYTFSKISETWVQLGSVIVKMIAAGAKYNYVRERRKKEVPYALQLPEEMVTELNKVYHDIDVIRYNYDVLKLAPENKAKMNKLQIKELVSERDTMIKDRLKEDSVIYQIYRLSTLNSNVIIPTEVLKFNRLARRSALEDFRQIFNVDEVKTSDDKIFVKRIENKYKRELRRAYLNRLLVSETAKFVANPKTYVAPDFV